MKILFVCTGNTCRSPLAEGYLNHKNFPGVRAISAGIMASGEKVNKNSAIAAKENGFNIDSHISRQLSKDIADSADIIYCMNTDTAALIKSAFPYKDIRVLSGGIPDPYGMDIDCYRKTASMIFAAVDMEFPKTIKAGKDDIPDIARLEKLCFSSPWSEKAVLESMDSGTLFYKAVIGGNTAGYLGIKTVLDEGYITNIAVAPEYRHKGIGSALLKRLEQDMAAKGLSFISLEVRLSNSSAQSLYTKFGYKVTGERRDFYTNPKENALIMTKELK